MYVGFKYIRVFSIILCNMLGAGDLLMVVLNKNYVVNLINAYNLANAQ
jgi:hypothetical protein